MRTFTQLTHEQRHQIYALMKMGNNQTEIANCIGVKKSTIRRKFKAWMNWSTNTIPKKVN